MTTLDDIAALLRQQNELMQRLLLQQATPTPDVIGSDKARRDAEARQRLEKSKRRASR